MLVSKVDNFVVEDSSVRGQECMTISGNNYKANIDFQQAVQARVWFASSYMYGLAAGTNRTMMLQPSETYRLFNKDDFYGNS
jgi:hypothetical protein